MIHERQRRAREPAFGQRTAKRTLAQRREDRTGRPFGDPIFQRSRQRCERSGPRVTAADRVVAFLGSGPPSAERLRRIEGGDRNDVDAVGGEARVLEARVDRMERKTDFELAPRESLFVGRERQAAVLQQGGAGVVTVPDAEYVHGVSIAIASACGVYDFGFGL